MTANRTTCPRCKWNLLGRMSALSRRDNKTIICPECGTQEAFEDSKLAPHWLDDPVNRPYWDTQSPTWLVQSEKLHDQETGIDKLKAQSEAADDAAWDAQWAALDRELS